MKQKISVGGQALIEGVMMRQKNTISMAVRNNKNQIETNTFKINFLEKISWYKKIPIFRGIVEMIVSLCVGYKCLLKSAKMAGLEEDLETKEKKQSPILNLISFLATVGSLFFSMLIFMFFPSFVVKKVSYFFYFNNFFKVLFEGIIKIAIFVIYILVISKMKEIKRTFQYHGAEHKTIFCFEKGKDLTVENVKTQIRFHPRCGTNFIFTVLIVSILLFSFLTWKNLFLRLIFKFSLLPVVTGISYEIIKLAGKKENILTKILVAPGLLMQRITTKEPDNSQIEVAIKSLKEVLKNS